MPLKIAMIGAGSIGFTRRLMADLLTVPEFADTTFAFTDINARNLDMVRQLAERDIVGNNLPAKIVATTDRRAAIADSDYVICMIRQGGLEAFQTERAVLELLQPDGDADVGVQPVRRGPDGRAVSRGRRGIMK